MNILLQQSRIEATSESSKLGCNSISFIEKQRMFYKVHGEKKERWYNGVLIPKNKMKLPLQSTYRKEITYRDTNTLLKYFSEKFKLSEETWWPWMETWVPWLPPFQISWAEGWG